MKNKVSCELSSFKYYYYLTYEVSHFEKCLISSVTLRKITMLNSITEFTIKFL